jgi:hypothetical protein
VAEPHTSHKPGDLKYRDQVILISICAGSASVDGASRGYDIHRYVHSARPHPLPKMLIRSQGREFVEALSMEGTEAFRQRLYSRRCA